MSQIDCYDKRRRWVAKGDLAAPGWARRWF